MGSTSTADEGACGVGQDWRVVAPNNAVLATSVVAIVVRQGNPKAIRDWDDLTRWTPLLARAVTSTCASFLCMCFLASVHESSASAKCRDDVETITANPKTAGVARWNFLALWGHHMRKGDSAALDYVTKVKTSSRNAQTHFGTLCNLGLSVLHCHNALALQQIKAGGNSPPPSAGVPACAHPATGRA